jgi:hypothetical protein
MPVLRVFVDIEYNEWKNGLEPQTVSDMLFSYVHGTLIPVLEIDANGSLEATPYDEGHKHVEGCPKCNNAMYDNRY